MAKPFDPDLHAKWDAKCRKALLGSVLLRSFLKKRFGVDRLVDNEPIDKHDIDFKGFGQRRFSIDVEAKLDPGWRGGNFPFETVQVPLRKKKYMSGLPTVFILFDKQLLWAAVVNWEPGEIFPSLNRPNSMEPEGGGFMAVSVGNVHFVKVRPEAEGPDVRYGIPQLGGEAHPEVSYAYVPDEALAGLFG